jgi:hypothetical protein
MNSAWKRPYPDAVHSFEGFNDMVIHGEIVKLTKEADFEEVEDSDVEKLLELHAVSLSNEVLAKLDKQTFEEESMDDGFSQWKGITVPVQQNIFYHND